jgi:metal-responsive CopG/Arc/MetJ family transcriptional regulator
MNLKRTVVMQSSIAVGISLPRDIMKKIDSERGDISRSRYLLRVLQNAYISDSNNRKTQLQNTKKNSLDRRFETLRSSESINPSS